ncbi:MAG: DinB family protein [Acidobacteriota bacterium]|nr:DinB family protein [Acidobacteriota bacterium]
MTKWIIGIAAVLALSFACTAPAAQQSSASPVADALRSLVARNATNMVGAADEMPADKFSYHPTPQQWTFAHLMVHATGANYGMCSAIAGLPMPKTDPLADSDPKDKIVSALKASFQFCEDSLKNVTDANLAEEIPFFGGRKVTRGAMMIIMADDYGDHYSQASGYLRLNGILPPSAQHRRP